MAACARGQAVPCRTPPRLLAAHEVAVGAHRQAAAAVGTADAGGAAVVAGHDAAHWQSIRPLGLQLAGRR
eukprot:scaffold189047_cov15-Tisochrysis_lutea.AAC.1